MVFNSPNWWGHPRSRRGANKIPVHKNNLREDASIRSGAACAYELLHRMTGAFSPRFGGGGRSFKGVVGPRTDKVNTASADGFSPSGRGTPVVKSGKNPIKQRNNQQCRQDDVGSGSTIEREQFQDPDPPMSPWVLPSERWTDTVNHV